jgi:hypothetical protein
MSEEAWVHRSPSHDQTPGVWCAVNTSPIFVHVQLNQNGLWTRIQYGFYRPLSDEQIISKKTDALMSSRSNPYTIEVLDIRIWNAL